MRKMESLNNMKKTVLKLEKEINAISNNLSKVKNKDHSTMKKIIHNINYLLTKDEKKNYKLNNENSYTREIEENKKDEEKKEFNQKKYLENNDININIDNDNNRNIDYILIPLNYKKKDDIEQNDPYFNKKSYSSSKIYNNIISEERIENYTKKYKDNNNNINYTVNDNIKNSNRNNNYSNNIIGYSNNQVLNKTNQLTYSKPKLMNEYSKKNLKNKINANINNNINTNINNNIENIDINNININKNDYISDNIININTNKSNKNSNNNIILNINTSNKSEEKENEPITNLKYLTLNQKIKSNNIETISKKPDKVNTLFFNYKNIENNISYKDNLNKKNDKYSTFDKIELNEIEKQNQKLESIEKNEENKKDKDEYKKEIDRNILLNNKKNKKFIFERKTKRNKTETIKSNSNIRNPLNLNNYNISSAHPPNTNFINKKNKKISYSSVDNEDLKNIKLSNKKDINNNFKFKYENKNLKNINEDLYINNNNKENENKLNINNNTQKNIRNLNYNFDENSNIKEDKNNDKDKINKLLLMLNVNNINEAIFKVDKLLNYENCINKLKDLYNDMINNNNYNEKIDLDKNLYWLSNIIKNYKKNEKYKNYCKNIMIQNKINHFHEFKSFIDNILVKNRKNKGFISEVKNILCEDDYYTNKNKNMNNMNRVNYEPSKKIKKENKAMNNSDNSNDIKYSQNGENFKMINEYMNTYY